MPRKKSDLSALSRNAKRARRMRLEKAQHQQIDEQRSARLAAARERQRQVDRNKIPKTLIEQVRIENVRTLRPNTDKRGPERDWLAALKVRMNSEKAWLNSTKERLNSDKGRLSFKDRKVRNGLHCEPQNYEKGTLNCEMNQFSSEKDMLNSEWDPVKSEWDPVKSEWDPVKSEWDPPNTERDPLNSEKDLLNSDPNLIVKAEPAQNLENYEVTIKVEVLDE